MCKVLRSVCIQCEEKVRGNEKKKLTNEMMKKISNGRRRRKKKWERDNNQMAKGNALGFKR